MKKVLIAIFLATIMLMVPLSAAGPTVKIPHKALNQDDPKMYMTETEFATLEIYIDENFQGDEHTQATQILNDVTSYDEENEVYIVDTNKLADTLDDYYYEPIDETTIDNAGSKTELLNLINSHWNINDYPFADFVNKIIEILKNRLGWIYELYSKTSDLFFTGIDLAIDFIELIQILELAKFFTKIVNLLIIVPIIYVAESIRMLFSLDIQGFVNHITNFTEIFTTNFSEFIVDLQDWIKPLGQAFDDIKDYVSDIGKFVDWITGPIKPWEKEITIKGSITTILGEKLSGAEVSCRGRRVTTGNGGSFEFTVQPTNTSEGSKPANSYYGLHDCQIVVSKDGEVLKQTPLKLSYVFSGGAINWPFIVFKGKPKDIGIRNFLEERLNLLFEKISIIFPNFFRLIKAYEL